MSATHSGRSSTKTSRFVARIQSLEAVFLEDWVFAAWLGMLAFSVLAFGTVEPWSLSIFQVGCLLVLVSWLIVKMHLGKLTMTIPPVLLPAFAFLALVVVQFFGGISAYRFATKAALLNFVTYGICLFLAAQLLDSERRFRIFGIALSGFGLALSCFAIVQSLTSPGEIYWSVVPAFRDGVFGPYVNHSHYAGLMEMLAPFPFVLGQSRNLQRNLRTLAFVAGTIMIGSVFVSGSRGGILAVMVQLILLYLLVFRRSNDEGLRLARSRSESALAIAVTVVLVAILGGQEMISRVSTLKDPYSPNVGATRLAIAKDSIAMFVHHPFVGWGAGVFQEAYPAYRSFSTNLIVNAAHNDYLQLLVEFGLLGLVIAAWFLISSYSRFSVLLRNWQDSWPHAVSLAAGFGALGILVHGLTDFNLQIPANAALFYVMCTVCSLCPPESDGANSAGQPSPLRTSVLS